MAGSSAGSLKVYLAGDIVFNSNARIAGGGFGDLFKGAHPVDGTLALKRLRLRSNATGSDRASLRAINNLLANG